MKRASSWSKPEGVSGLIGRKGVDQSFISDGETHIPDSFEEEFDAANNGQRIPGDESRDLTLVYQGTVYRGVLRNQRKGRPSDTYQLRIDSDLLLALRRDLDASVSQVEEIASDENEIEGPSDDAGQVEFYRTGTPFRYQIEVVHGETGDSTGYREWAANEDLPEQPSFVRGERYERQAIHDAYGGNEVKGISRPAHHDVIFLFASPDAPYEDEYLEDGSIVYPGQGAEGDMEWEAENVYLRDHKQTGHNLHFFRGVGDGEYEYLGGYFVADSWMDRGKDPGGGERDVIKFHLRPVRQRQDADGTTSSTVRSSGQGYRPSKELRDAVERQAVRAAASYYRKRGWYVDDVGDRESYDLRCRKQDKELHVEVKGTSGEPDTVNLTANEVAHAREWYPNTALFVLHDIKVEDRDGAEVSGGETVILHPWRINENDLEATQYRYNVPRAED